MAQSSPLAAGKDPDRYRRATCDNSTTPGCSGSRTSVPTSWDLTAPGLRAAWEAGDRSRFHPFRPDHT
jgi:hypothetical protein